MPDSQALNDYVIRSASLYAFSEAVLELGGKPETFFLQEKLALPAVQDPYSFIPYGAFVRLLNSAAEQLNCPYFGYLLAQKKGAHHFGILSLIVETSTTVREALVAFGRYLQIQTKVGTSEIREQGKQTFWVHTIHYPGEESLYQAYIHALGIGRNIVQLLGGTHLVPLSLRSTFDTPADDSYIRSHYYPCPIIYNAEFNGCVFATADLEQPLPKSNPILNQILQEQIEALMNPSEHDYELELKNVMRRAMDIGDPSIERVANYLSLNKRSLQRQLEERGLQYKRLLDDVRLDTAKHHLRYSALSLAHIADMLGYSDPSSFSRFFTKQTGLSPLKWRKTQ